ncbi:MAG: hybrid sensor histidine kinase/response regulator [Porcipelethomonas sp.]
MNNTEFEQNIPIDSEILINAVKSIYPIAISINLTTNEYHTIKYTIYKTRKSNQSGTYDALIRRIVSDIPDRRQKKEFENIFLRYNLITGFEDGESEFSCRHRYMHDNLPSNWLETKILLVRSGGDIQGILLSKEVDAEMRRLNDLKKDSFYKKAILADDIVTMFECNLSLNMVTSDVYEINKGVERVKTDELGLAPPFTVNDIMKLSLVSSYFENDFDFSNRMSCDHLIELFEKGNSTPEFTYWKNDQNGQKKCLKNTFYITRSEETGDIMAFSVLKDITQIKIEQDANISRKIMLDGISENYECVFSFNLETRAFTVYRSSELFERCSYLKTGNSVYKGDALDVINGIIYQPDQKHVYEATKKERILRELSHNDTYCVSFRMLVDDGPQYYQAKITYPGNSDTQDSIVIAIHNVNAEMRAEAERIKQLQVQQVTNMQHEAVINSISDDFEGIYYVNPDTDEKIVYRPGKSYISYVSDFDRSFSFDEGMKFFAERLVFSEDRDTFIKASTIQKIEYELTKAPVYYINFRMLVEEKTIYYRMKIIRDNNILNNKNIIIGIQNVDAVTRRELEQHKMLEILQEKERNYQKAVFSDASGFFECNLTKNLVISDIFELIDGEFQIVSNNFDMPMPFKFDEFKRLFIYTHEVPNPKDVVNFVNCEHLIDCYNKGNHMPEITFWARTPSGVMRCHREIFFLTKDEKSGDILALSIIKDVSEQQRKADELKQNHDIIEVLASEYTSVFHVNLKTLKITPYYIYDNIDDVIIEHIRSGNFDYLDIVNLYLDLIVYEEDIEYVAEVTSVDYICEQFRTAKSFSATPRRYENGELRYYEMRFIKVGDSPEPTEFVLGLLDRNDQIKKEQEHQRQLQIARENAEAANHAKSTFLFNMSHDIRTPMNAIIGFTSMAQKYLDDKKRVNEYLEKVKVSSTHLLQLINDVLDMARIESGKVTIEETAASVFKNTYDVVSIMQESAKEHDITLTTNIENIRNEHVYADVLHFNQVLLNIISNAVKYTRPGGKVNVYVTQTPDEKEDNASFDFIVSDTGIGMSPEFQKHIFESFMREKTSTISGIQGTGLGMSITKQLVDLMGGTISVKSELGIGTTVKVHISFRIQKRIPANNVEKNEDAIVNLEGMRVLLVEDNELNREIARDILEEAGIIVEEAEDGSVAVEMVSKSEPGYYDLILMDIQMPYMDGYKATQTIRAFKDRELASVPIVAMTANAFEEDKNKALESGMNSHLAKPINIGELLETLSIFGSKKYNT